MTETLVIEQATTRTIRVTDITDADGAPLDVTGWNVHAVVRAGPGSPVLAEWATDPTGDQGRAVTDGTEITLEITPELSGEWSWGTAQLQIQITETSGRLRSERIADQRVRLSRSLIPRTT